MKIRVTVLKKCNWEEEKCINHAIKMRTEIQQNKRMKLLPT